MCGDNELSLKTLCATCSVLDNACLGAAQINQASANSITANSLCVSGPASAQVLQSVDFSTNTLCARSGTINDLCVTNLSVMNNVSTTKYRAAVTKINDSYTLGTNLDWNNVIDDPNNNVSLAPFFYTVPVSGYYNASYYINSINLTGAQPILGSPIGLLTIYVNGNELRQFNAPFLSFNSQQYGLLSSLLLLNAGDKVTMDYNVLVLDPVSGLKKYVGTVSLIGTSAFADSSGFEIILLSQLASGPVPPTCRQCPVISVPCQPNSIDCSKFTCTIPTV